MTPYFLLPKGNFVITLAWIMTFLLLLKEVVDLDLADLLEAALFRFVMLHDLINNISIVYRENSELIFSFKHYAACHWKLK